MRKTTRHFPLFSVLLTIILFGTSAFSTKNSDPKNFIIEFQSTNDGLKLIGLKGTAFKQLTFTLRDNFQQGIDEFGMTSPDIKKNTNDDNLADFKFTIQKVNKEYILAGKTGTAWTKLSFTFSQNNKAIVDQNGVTVK